MNQASPLRYPGGKSAMVDLLAKIRRLNRLGGLSVAEPFAGGAGASLGLLFAEETKQIVINDADPAIHAFWWSILNCSQRFVSLLKAKRVSMAEWYRQRHIYRAKSPISRLQRGFAAFYLNRCNRSGIIRNGGPIGGVEQSGKWKLNARFNKKELQRRCERVSEYATRIHVTSLDGIEFLSTIDAESTMFFIDPPYFHKGRTLYLNSIDSKYHALLADKLASMDDSSWVLTYDDCPEVRRLYSGWATIRPFSLRYVAAQRRTGMEVLITPKWLRLPSRQSSASIDW
jgi:DNA adenine methylase